MTKKLFFSVFFLLVWAAGSSGYAKQTEMKDVPKMLQSLISAKMGEDNPAYQVQGDGDLSYVTKNQKHGLTMKVCPEGMTVQSEGGLNWGTKLKGFGLYKKIESRSNRIEVEFGDITEWFINGPSGIEQGWTLKRNTSSHSGNKDAEEIVIQLAQSGNTRVAAAAARDLEVKKEDGSVFLRYGGLFAHDAEGKELEARFEMADGDILVRVDGRNAVYPVTIDPYVRTAILKASGEVSDEELGTSVAISSNGTVVAAGAPDYDDGKGRVYVFVKGNTWVQSAILTASDGESEDELGNSVAISDLGDVIAVGARYYNGDEGGVYVFVKGADTWANRAEHETKILTADDADDEELGASVAISGDGKVIAAGGPDLDIDEEYYAGGVYVFVQTNDTWANSDENEAIRLTASEPGEDHILGESVAISHDGSVIAAGASGMNGYEGGVYVFVKGDGTWANSDENEAIILTASVGEEDSDLGTSVAISGDGKVIVAGADDLDIDIEGTTYSCAGGVYVFVKGDTWANSDDHEAIILTAASPQIESYLGVSVAISYDGSVIAAGAESYYLNEYYYENGAVYVFVKGADTWANRADGYETALLTEVVPTYNDPTSQDGCGHLGISVAISSDGSVIAAGAC